MGGDSKLEHVLCFMLSLIALYILYTGIMTHYSEVVIQENTLRGDRSEIPLPDW